MYKNSEITNYIEKLICVNKVSKTTTGGRRLAFAALVVVGDGKGRVGYGTGKAREVGDARSKAVEDAKRSMIRVPMKEGRTIHHSCEGYHGCGHVILRPAPAGTGIVSGGPMRAVFECLGLSDIVSKSLGTNNPFNMILATFDALKAMNSPKNVADRRSKPIGEITRRRRGVTGGLGENAANGEKDDTTDAADLTDDIRKGVSDEEDTKEDSLDVSVTEDDNDMDVAADSNDSTEKDME